MIVKQCSISEMRSERTSCVIFIMFNVFFIGTCVKSDSTSKLPSRSVGRRISWIFCMKSVELVMYDSDFLMRDCSVYARKRSEHNIEIGYQILFDHNS